MENSLGAKDLIRVMCARFDRDARPLINIGFYEQAAFDVKIILEQLGERRSEIIDVPSGLNYMISLEFLLSDLRENRRPSGNHMQEYDAYSAQAKMRRGC